MRVRSPREQEEAEAQEARVREQGRPERARPRVDDAVEGVDAIEPEDRRTLEGQVMGGQRPTREPGRWGGKGLWAALIAVLLLIVLIGAYGY
ncbi:MAG: hypothetical protein WD270_13325 [Acetobacterales bacterium]